MSVLDSSIDKIMGVLSKKSAEQLPSIHVPPAGPLQPVRENVYEESLMGGRTGGVDTRFLTSHHMTAQDEKRTMYVG